MLSSHQAFSWNLTATRLSYAFFSVFKILRPFPQKIWRGLMRGSPSAKMVNWTVHCHLSKPDCAPRCQTDFVPVWSYPWPLLKVKGRGVWSTFAIVDRLNLPSGPASVSLDAATHWISRWKLRTFTSWSVGLCWATHCCVFNLVVNYPMIIITHVIGTAKMHNF